MLIAKKESLLELQQVSSSIHSSTGLYGDQVIIVSLIYISFKMKFALLGVDRLFIFDE